MANDGKIRFNLIHLIVIVGSVLFVIGLLLPWGRFNRERSWRLKCSSNLRTIGLAIKMYAAGETRTGSFPRTRHSPETADHPTAFTRPNATQPFADDGPLPNDVTAAMFLILRTQEIAETTFVCPDDKTSDQFYVPKGKTIQSFSNFSAQNQLSYSMQNPYPTKEAEAAGFTWNDRMSADFAIMADKNPGVGELLTLKITDAADRQQQANSLNHDRLGQNILYAAGYVDSSDNVWAGTGMNNIYGYDRFVPPTLTLEQFREFEHTANKLTPVGIVGPPGGPNDSVLLPTAQTKVP